MLVFPNSKINLGLKVLAKRADGYHSIESVFYPIPYTDVLEILAIENGPDQFIYSGLPIPGSGDGNLCEKAISLLRTVSDFPFVSVHLHKAIAMGAGLGGGSSDATYVLLAIRDKFNLNISNKELERLALKIGSDCPFFVENVPVSVSGRGEFFESIQVDLNDCVIVVVTSNIHISTSKAYSNIQRQSDEMSPSEIVSTLSLEEWANHLHNDFEGYAFKQFPRLEKTKSDLYRLGAIYASMTGSGSAIYGIFQSSINEKTLKETFGHSFWMRKL